MESREKVFHEGRGAELDDFTGIEHRLRGDAAEQERNAYAKKGYTICAADARSTTEVEDVDAAGGKVKGLEEHEGRVVQLWENCKGEFQIVAAYPWHSVRRRDMRRR